MKFFCLQLDLLRQELQGVLWDLVDPKEGKQIRPQF